MRIAWHSNSFYFLGLISVVSFAISHFLSEPKPLARSDYLAPPKVIEKLSSGLKVASSDSFWLRAIQDFDFCSAPINDRECQGKSWLFHVLDLATDLDPRFYYAFYAGGLDLTVVISDYEGASKIFDKGVPLYPKKWGFLYAAGYHAYFEEKNKVKAANLFFQAAENGAPEWLKVTAGRLAKEGGDTETSERILQQLIQTSDDPKLVERLKKKLSDLKSTNE